MPVLSTIVPPPAARKSVSLRREHLEDLGAVDGDVVGVLARPAAPRAGPRGPRRRPGRRRATGPRTVLTIPGHGPSSRVAARRDVDTCLAVSGVTEGNRMSLYRASRVTEQRATYGLTPLCSAMSSLRAAQKQMTYELFLEKASSSSRRRATRPDGRRHRPGGRLDPHDLLPALRVEGRADAATASPSRRHPDLGADDPTLAEVVESGTAS